MAHYRAPFAWYEELAAHIQWFKTWYGLRWCEKTERESGMRKGEIDTTLHGRCAFNIKTLHRLRRLRIQLEARSSLAIRARAREQQQGSGSLPPTSL